LLPVLGIVRTGHDYIADRFTYLPSIGFLVVLVWYGGELAVKFLIQRNYLAMAVGLALAIFSVVTVRQIAHWRNTETLFRHTLAVRPDNILALSNLSAYLLSKDGGTPEALDMLRRAMLRNGNTAAEWNNYGAALFMQKRYRDAIAAYERAVRIAPTQFEAHCNLGHALIAVGQTNHGLLELKEALRYRPDDAKNLEAVQATISRLQNAGKSDELHEDGRGQPSH
jgi:tetratricopeptide (TPR) repeat protein